MSHTGEWREIGGYLELEHFYGKEYHEGLIALDCARNALAYLIEARHIELLWIPAFLCSSVPSVADKYGITVRTYPIDKAFRPDYGSFSPTADDYVYLVDFYGQLTDEDIRDAARRFPNHLIVDEVMAFYRKPLDDLDTIYSCRKFFGVSDGAYLATTAHIKRELPQDESWDKMRFVLGRFERPASEFYAESSDNNVRFRTQDIHTMSPITQNLLRAIDYERTLEQRRQNYTYLSKELDCINQLSLNEPFGPFMYPLLLERGRDLRKPLQQRKLYISMLWDHAADEPGVAGRYANDILPLPVDQRYTQEDMAHMVDVIRELMSD